MSNAGSESIPHAEARASLNYVTSSLWRTIAERRCSNFLRVRRNHSLPADEQAAFPANEENLPQQAPFNLQSTWQRITLQAHVSSNGHI
jgi:hypothetical protein